MNHITFFSGPCGVGKTTLANAYASHLVESGQCRQVYVIHGDDFHAGLVETKERVGSHCEHFLYWPDILRFNWECILSVAEKALARGLDVVIDYVIEDELPLVQELAERYQSKLYYVVLTAEQEVIRQRLTTRGDTALIERALFLKQKLDHMPENQGHLYDSSEKSTEQIVTDLDMNAFEVQTRQ